jgi:hypothetical protein
MAYTSSTTQTIFHQDFRIKGSGLRQGLCKDALSWIAKNIPALPLFDLVRQI